MNFIRNLFNTSKVECPRCLGKGEVNWDDIRRLKKDLKWQPGKCAYCNGKGEVAPNMLDKVAVDNSYLVIDLPEEERKKLINRDKDALERAHQFDIHFDDLKMQVEYLHFKGNLKANEIADFYLISKMEANTSAQERIELIEYIEKIIAQKKGE